MKNKKLFIVFGVIALIVVVMFVIRTYNLSRKESTNTTTDTQNTVQNSEPSTQSGQDSQSNKNENSGFTSSIDRDKHDKPSKDESLSTETETESEIDLVPTNIDVSCNIFDHTSVPTKNMDGSSCKKYLSSVSIQDFGAFWGTELTDADRQSVTKYMIGTEQDSDDYEVADLQSVGWLIDNIGNMSESDAIKFTNLHVIGGLSKTHVAVLCSYDWYSAFGLRDTLVFFEDISGTLKVEDFVDGSIFSTTAFVHNIKVKTINGYDVVCVQYNVFK